MYGDDDDDDDNDDWLTSILKFVRRRLESTVERYASSWWFFQPDDLRTIFVLSRLYFICYTHILSEIISAIFLW